MLFEIVGIVNLKRHANPLLQSLLKPLLKLPQKHLAFMKLSRQLPQTFPDYQSRMFSVSSNLATSKQERGTRLAEFFSWFYHPSIQAGRRTSSFNYDSSPLSLVSSVFIIPHVEHLLLYREAGICLHDDVEQKIQSVSTMTDMCAICLERHYISFVSIAWTDFVYTRQHLIKFSTTSRS